MKAKKCKVTKRTSSYVGKALNEFQQLMMVGYTHDNFNNIARCLGKISGHLFLEELKVLQELWRDSFTDSCDQADLVYVIEGIRARF